MEQLSLANPGVSFVKVDVDENPTTSEQAGISAVPTFQGWVGGAKVGTCSGANKVALDALVAKVVEGSKKGGEAKKSA